MAMKRWLELSVGVFVVGGLAALTMLAFKVANLGALDVVEGYQVKARFENIGQLKTKAPVTLAGVRIGRVSDINIDDRYYAVVTLNISRKYNNLPEDTGASILTAGLLGEQYISLEPGGADAYLKEGDTLRITQSALVLEKLISQFLYSKASEGGK
jgi:phospholipid/cholesterol/gamma-HCH transport system substrate-binding protein